MSGTERSTEWWTWVQLAVLCVSLPTNVVLWLRNENIQATRTFAESNDRAWTALEDFERKSELAWESIYQHGRPVLELADPAEESWLTQVLSLEREWIEGIKECLEPSVSRIRAESTIVDGELKAMTALSRRLEDLEGPSAVAQRRLSGIIRELELQKAKIPNQDQGSDLQKVQPASVRLAVLTEGSSKLKPARIPLPESIRQHIRKRMQQRIELLRGLSTHLADNERRAKAEIRALLTS